MLGKWLSKRRLNDNPATQNRNDRIQETRERQEEVFAAHPIGSLIRFLEVNMIVAGHRRYFPRNRFFPGWPPGIICEYLNSSGEIKEHVFSIEQIESIDSKNPTQ